MAERGPYLKRALTPKQQAFVKALHANGGNQTAAARAAGYANPEKAGYMLMRNKRIQVELGRASAVRPSKINEIAPLHDLASPEARKRWLLDVATGKQKIRRRNAATGKVREDEAPWAIRLKALEMVAKMNGEFVQSHEHRFGEGFSMPRSDRELDERLAAAHQRIKDARSRTIDVTPTPPKELPSE